MRKGLVVLALGGALSMAGSMADSEAKAMVGANAMLIPVFTSPAVVQDVQYYRPYRHHYYRHHRHRRHHRYYR